MPAILQKCLLLYKLKNDKPLMLLKVLSVSLGRIEDVCVLDREDMAVENVQWL